MFDKFFDILADSKIRQNYHCAHGVQSLKKNFARGEIQSKLGEIYCRLGSLSILAGGTKA